MSGSGSVFLVSNDEDASTARRARVDVANTARHRMARLDLIIAVLGIVLCSCSHAASEPFEGRAIQAHVDLSSGQPNLTRRSFIGVWLFSHGPDSWEQALFSGKAAIRGGCLMVDDSVVVWEHGNLGYAESLVQALQSGESPSASSIVGGQSDVVPAEVAETCGAQYVIWNGRE